CAAIEHADVVQAEEPAGENVATGRVLAVHPPGEIHEQLVELTLQEAMIGLASEGSVHQEDLPDGLAMDRWVHVAEVPLVRGNLPVRMQVDLVGHQAELLFRELEIDPGEHDAVEGEVPRGEP